jgi:hypothetical protein
MRKKTAFRSVSVVITFVFAFLLVASVCLAGIRWADNGVAVCTAAGDQTYPQMTTDGAGGAIITWEDSRGISDDIYAQRIDPAGTVQWNADGVAVCTDPGQQQQEQIISDGAGFGRLTDFTYLI